MPAQCAAGRHVETRRGAEVVEHVAIAQLRNFRCELVHRGIVVDAGGHIVKAIKQAAQSGAVAFSARDAQGKAVGHGAGERFAVQLAAGGAEDTQARW